MAHITFQQKFCPPLPEIDGSKDYRDKRELYERMDQLITDLGLDTQFARLALKDHQKPSERKKDWMITAYRIQTVRMLSGVESLRQLASDLADSMLLQWFCRLEHFGVSKIKAPSKSTIDRIGKLLAVAEVEKLNNILLQACGSETEARRLGLERSLEMAEAWFDATCVKAHIHYPTDWVLLVDAVGTLMKGVARIREQQVRHRMMDSPKSFISRMNTLCMTMAQLKGKKGGPKKSRKVLRDMIKMVRRCAKHAENHLKKLEKGLEKTAWSEAQAAVVRGRIERVLDQLPEALEQAENRILRGKLTPSPDKILSLYESDINVVKRGKGSVNTEFGNVLLAAEQEDGLLVDLKLYKENRGDATLLQEGVERVEAATDQKMKRACADRGFHSAENEAWLKEQRIESMVAPRDVSAYAERHIDEVFREKQKRRAQTEGRIAIVKNVFMDGQLRSKGFENRETTVTWVKLAHNIRGVARILMNQAAARERGRKQAA